MAKKQKRSVSTATVRNAPETAPNGNRPAYTPVTASRVSYSQEFNPDYSVVIADLKRIGIMAGSGFVFLVVLSFFLH